MFKRRFQLKQLWCVVWWCACATAVAQQSNQPFDIDHLPDESKYVDTARPSARTPRFAKPVKPDQSRLTQLAQKWADVPDAPASPKSPAPPDQVMPVRQPHPSRTALPVDLNQTDSATSSSSTLIDPVERQPLGRPSHDQAGDESEIRSQGTSGSGWVLSTLMGLGIVVALIFLLRVVMSRLSGRGLTLAGSSAVEVLSRVSVAPRNHILLIRTGHRVLVVGDSSAGLRTLANIDDPDEVASLLASTAADKPRSISRGFSQLLSHFNSEYRDDLRRVEEGNDTSEHRVDRARDQVSNLLTRVRAMASRGGAS